MNETPSVNWGKETTRILGIVGKILLRLLSYLMNVILTVLLIGLITAIIVGSVFAIYINNYLDLEIDPSTIVQISSDSTTRIYYMDYDTEEDRINRNGTPVEIDDQRLYGTENAIAVSYSQLPKNLINAFISIEDKRFWDHNGADWIGTINGFLGFITGGGRGGSTITQQLVKNVTGEDEVTIQRKVQEIFRAINLEKVKSKEEILEAYLNIVFFGNNCYGVQAASEYYFGKDVSDLSLTECAALAAIVKNPSQYDPKRHEDDYYITVDGEEVLKRGNAYRRWTVLEEMKDNGMINETECKKAQEERLEIYSPEDDDETLSEGMTLFSWYTESMLTQIHTDLMEEYNVDSRTAWNMIYYNGYKIYTPMDPDVQGVLEEVYENDSEYFPMTGSGLQPQSAACVCDPYTGDVLGIVGGRGKKTINRGIDRAAVSTRPPGSSIKPLSVYGPALDAGIITYGSTIDDSPVYFNASYTGATDGEGKPIVSYKPYPLNLPNIYRGLTTVHNGVRLSINTVAMKVLQKLGVDYSFDFMKNKLHFDSLIESVTLSNGETITDRGLAALALGQPNYGVTLLEMTGAYCMFQNNGVYNEPALYLYITDADGNIILENDRQSEIVISDASASIMRIMMEEVMNEGTGTGCTLRHTVDVAGKTGTTNADFDRYFMGFTPYYVGGVWTGYDIPQSLSSFSENPSLIVWDKIMTKLHQKYVDEAKAGGEQLRHFELSPSVVTCEYCVDSGKLPSNDCYCDPRGNRVETGYFTKDTLPKDECETHVLVKRDDSTGLIASDGCDPDNCSETALVRVENRSYPAEVYIQDAQFVYRDVSPYVEMSKTPGTPFFANMLREGEYCGSSYVEVPFNAFCYTHADDEPSDADDPDETDPENPDEEQDEENPGQNTDDNPTEEDHVFDLTPTDDEPEDNNDQSAEENEDGESDSDSDYEN